MSRSPRDTALFVLSACRDLGAWSDGSLKKAIARDGLDSRDAAFASRLCYGVLQNRAMLDSRLGLYCTQRVDHLEPAVREVLRLGAYQILFMDRVPDSAAVSESVEQIRRAGRPQAAGLVNAVLRKLAASKEQLPPIEGRTPAETLSIRYSHPHWLTVRLISLLGAEEAERFLAENNRPAPMTIQTNSLKTTPEDLRQELSAAGATAEPHPWMPGCFELSGSGDLEKLEAFQAGRFTVQDPAARLVSMAAGLQGGEFVIDTCAAPGGKSFAAAMEMKNKGRILSCDVHTHKLKLIESGAARLGITIIETAQADGREPKQELLGAADAVIVDAPCSGLGIIRKKPDIRYKDPKALQNLPAVQSAILRNAAAYVRPGGTLLYSTCTILPEENEGVTEAFLQTHPAFQREAFALPFGGEAAEITLWPQRHRCDGFYICKMRKSAL
ncbi:MAG: 16S rRNA (cytosine(967)-C(5))-methyltransferase RsmB [Oscillospiraceae bacterium]